MKAALENSKKFRQSKKAVLENIKKFRQSKNSKRWKEDESVFCENLPYYLSLKLCTLFVVWNTDLNWYTSYTS